MFTFRIPHMISAVLFDRIKKRCRGTPGCLRLKMNGLRRGDGGSCGVCGGGCGGGGGEETGEWSVMTVATVSKLNE
uniref:Uncharacterized protein n=1 Tax=Salix viminalis TaxID=40686 RepID=A0A6N2LMM7_SALVM